ncbi:MAG: Amidohydrolase [Candidatus Izimaplasma bacterium HR2]|nr:MAG: Amidohydrolase [Candidatus Izimaplasma bacterium HR2]
MIKIKNNNYKIIDAHLHLPWEDKYETIDEKYKALKHEMKINNIDHGLLIADSLLDTTIGNNKDCLRIVEKDSNLSLIYGYSPLEREVEQLDEVRGLLNFNKVKGIKLYPGHDDFSMNDIRLDKIFKLCIEFDIPIALHTEWNDDYFPQYSHPFFIKQIAEKYPTLKVVCCHMWMPRVIESLKLTKDLNNIYYDISSFSVSKKYLEKYPNAGFPTKEEAISLLEQIMNIVPNKVMFGSDYGTLLINDHIDTVLKSNLNDEQLQKLLYLNASRIYNI